MGQPSASILATPIQHSHEQPWWKVQPLSILELADPLHVAAHGRKAFDPARVVARMRELNATAAHVFPLGCHLDGDVLFFRHRSEGDPPPSFDYLGEWLEHSIPAGLRTVVYFNVHSVKGAYARRHPQWQAKRFDSSPKDDVYNIESTFCVNSPWRDWVFQRLRELCVYPIDGIFYDGPVFFDDCCFCEHCRRLFESAHSGTMPSMTDLKDPRYPLLVEFRADGIARFVRESRDLIKSIRRDLLFYVNANPLQPARLTARDNRKLADCVDVLASEGGFLGGDLMSDSPIWKVGMNAKLLESQASGAGVPHLVFDSVIHTPWTYYTLPAAEARLLWASSVAHGAATWMSAYKNSMDRPAVGAVGELYGFAAAHRAELWDTRSAADVAVVVSAATLDYYAGADVPGTDFTAPRAADLPGNVTRELYGWYHALWTAHLPFDVIDEVSIESVDLSRYRVLVLPNSACMSDASARNLRRFVESGGTVIASFESGFYDECGRRREVPALEDVLGARSKNSKVEGPRQWDYLFDAGGLSMPSPSYALDTTLAPAARARFTFSRALADRYAGLPENSARPAVVEHCFGKGVAIYFACDIGAAMWRWRLPEHLSLARELVRKHAEPLLELPNLPPCIDVSLRRSRNGQRLFVHLVNYNGGMTRPIERVLPLRDVVVRVRAHAAQARTLLKPLALDINADGEWVTVRVPVLNVYEIVEFVLA